MPRSLQHEWFIDVVESAPSFAFLALWRSGFDLEFAGWTGSGLATILLLAFYFRKVRFNPILLGINIHLIIVTPLIVALFLVGASQAGTLAAASSYEAVLVTIFITGCALTLWSPAGFVGADNLPPPVVRVYSILLLAGAAAAVLWAFTADGGPFATVALPIIMLFALRRLLIARSIDNNANLLEAASAGAAFSVDGGPDG